LPQNIHEYIVVVTQEVKGRSISDTNARVPKFLLASKTLLKDLARAALVLIKPDVWTRAKVSET